MSSVLKKADKLNLSLSLSLRCMTQNLNIIVNIGSGNGLVPSGNEPLPEPMLTQIYVTIWPHQDTSSDSWQNLKVEIYDWNVMEFESSNLQ